MKAPVVVLLVTTALIIAAQGQATPTAPGRIVTTTRLVALFSQLESDCLKAVQRNDQLALNRLLSEDFEVWTPAPPGHPIPREDWVEEQTAHKASSFRTRQMAVRSVADDTSIVSFVLRENSGANARESFIVDVWKKTGENWQLTDRYEAAVPPQHTAPTTVDRRPTGKN